jgi:hypothetical protein
MTINDPEKRRACKRAWDATHKVEQAAYNKAYRESHQSEIQAYREANRVHLREINNARNHRNGGLPLIEAKDSSLYLGVVIAERALSKYFDNITRMPFNNPGYDFLCGRGYKIDVKSACLYHNRWQIRIRENTAADYFLILLFDNRDDLNPRHLLLVPGHVINDHVTISISRDIKHFMKWTQYEKPLDKVIACCNTMRSEAKT